MKAGANSDLQTNPKSAGKKTENLHKNIREEFKEGFIQTLLTESRPTAEQIMKNVGRWLCQKNLLSQLLTTHSW